MEGENGVKLHGMRATTYSKRVELALRLKGVRYEYTAEDLSKSELLLEYDPVHKNVLVLVHNGKPIAESYIVLEYIDETWNSAPKILPEDPYRRAKLFEGTSQVARSQGEAQKKALEEVFARLGAFEEGMEYLHGGDSFTNGEIWASWTY
ncbi:glutathione S-transferase U9-like [Pyrus communis]|uniref:glutathione S-transferase U9-like n=1 Tax=Pyrus communis TaxID=23211 RepID=UPI0035C1C069